MVRSRILAELFRNQTARQCGLLIGTQGVGMVLSLVFTLLITKGLDVGSYGLFRYAMTFLGLAVTVLQLGWPYSAARLLAVEKQPSAQKEIVGACILITLASAAVGAVATLVVFFAAEGMGYHLPRILLWVAPFLHVALGQYMIRNVCQGLNRISLLSFQQVLPYLLLLPLTAVQIFLVREYSLVAAVAGYVLVFSAVVGLGFIQLGFSFGDWTSWLRVIGRENRKTGFPIYIGGIFGVASSQVVSLSVAEFVDPAIYGQFALALAISAPLAVLVSSVGTVVFRSSSNTQALSKRVLFYSFALGAFLGLFYFVATDSLLVRMFGARYESSVRMAQALGVGSLMIGLGDIFQRFLGSHGQGKALCLIAIATGAVGIASAAALLPAWKVYGAVASNVFSAATYLGLMVGMYLLHTRPRDPDLVEREGAGALAPKMGSGAA